MQTFKIHFADGEKNIFVPYQVKRISRNEVEVTLQTGDLRGGIRGLTTRKIKFEGNQVYWVGKDGIEYPVKSFSQGTISESIGWWRPINSSRTRNFEFCEWQKRLKETIPDGPVSPSNRVN